MKTQQTDTVRTTVELPVWLYKEAKRAALRREQTLKQMFQKALMETIKVKAQAKTPPRVGGYDMGKMKGDFKRSDLYEKILDHRVR